MTKVTDQIGRQVEVNSVRRVVSLVPSITELLIDMGVNVVGRTKFCIHPSNDIDDVKIIGGTKKFRYDEIEKQEPDLIVGNKEENDRVGIEKLETKYPVWISDISSVEDALQLVTMLGSVLNKEENSEGIVAQLKKAYEALAGKERGTIMYFIWKNPWMTAGQGTYIDTMLRWCGYENVIKDDRYPTLNLSNWTLENEPPEQIFLSSEPFPFSEKHIDEVRSLFPKTKIKLVNGEFYSWYGTRLLKLGDDRFIE